MRVFSFEKLIVWQKSRELSKVIYNLTHQFPEDERFGLISQMRRCSVSISSNIAEGTGRHSNKDKARFTEIAYGSALELLNQAILSNDLKFLSDESLYQIRTNLSEITAMLDSLYKSQLKV
ncbi:four helix bundle protein [Gelidibacter salicanalis]|uniref:Four helix bundle protein n=1 Tax=Gelidibacter salicanalis TaxID=291193 RepID=A0A934KYH8_9FLAO|nr:four helix bundle protein [Gelidibacter salicanalis]MBJ7882758.1 four helix bundle protein [Gelidibacter salicanalis]